MWDATSTLEALGAADVALWVWEPEKDRMRLTGATRALGLGPLAPDCSSAALRALTLPQDRSYAEDILRVQEAGTEVAVRLRMRGAGISIWRGVWLEEGVRAAGVVRRRGAGNPFRRLRPGYAHRPAGSAQLHPSRP
jgi:c-di-GMP-specific phosphodiesterase